MAPRIMHAGGRLHDYSHYGKFVKSRLKVEAYPIQSMRGRHLLRGEVGPKRADYVEI